MGYDATTGKAYDYSNGGEQSLQASPEQMRAMSGMRGIGMARQAVPAFGQMLEGTPGAGSASFQESTVMPANQRASNVENQMADIEQSKRELALAYAQHPELQLSFNPAVAAARYSKPIAQQATDTQLKHDLAIHDLGTGADAEARAQQQMMSNPDMVALMQKAQAGDPRAQATFQQVSGQFLNEARKEWQMSMDKRMAEKDFRNESTY